MAPLSVSPVKAEEVKQKVKTTINNSQVFLFLLLIQMSVIFFLFFDVEKV